MKNVDEKGLFATLFQLLTFINNLNSPIIIRKITASLLLFVLVLSTVPKPFIHSLLADHHDVDNSCAHTSHKAPCVKKTGINCHFDDLVVNLPYVDSCDISLSPLETQFSSFSEIPAFLLLPHTSLSKDNRGPPMVD